MERQVESNVQRPVGDSMLKLHMLRSTSPSHAPTRAGSGAAPNPLPSPPKAPALWVVSAIKRGPLRRRNPSIEPPEYVLPKHSVTIGLRVTPVITPCQLGAARWHVNHDRGW